VSLLQGNAHNSPKPRLRLIRQGFPDRPAFGTGVSEAVLKRVAAGELDPTFRLHRPARELAFSKQDRAAPGFERAVRSARAAGFEPVVRLAGGRAAAFHEGTLAFAWATPAERPVAGTQERFERLAEIVTRALRGLGVDARVGEVPGEYCPGAWSINARGRTKLAGIGQRLITGGAHAGGVLVVSDSALLREALEPVYAALELEWDPATAGSVEDEVAAVTLDDAEQAIVAELAGSFELVDAELDPETLALGVKLAPGHEALA
jgi:octanoyl-[GcvH]:protein N-octanoyltransferase